ncbi:hypothetical protein N7519_002084 [Penicillium mononematosum]|uniref:uncharacterized protein n=1 Tax=Penicillium mononematosum TaxID=268346 RepID=UPI0025481EE4|nr:uncharacterized protein N7519_002084 [Penicillium mononematosum]KAJ6187176.1 hypothetical protein N7519_002084 [Penicillium mononematosum]
MTADVQVIRTPVHGWYEGGYLEVAGDPRVRFFFFPFTPFLSGCLKVVTPLHLLRCVRIIPEFGIGCLTNMDCDLLFMPKFQVK